MPSSDSDSDSDSDSSSSGSSGGSSSGSGSGSSSYSSTTSTVTTTTSQRRNTGAAAGGREGGAGRRSTDRSTRRRSSQPRRSSAARSGLRSDRASAAQGSGRRESGQRRRSTRSLHGRRRTDSKESSRRSSRLGSQRRSLSGGGGRVGSRVPPPPAEPPRSRPAPCYEDPPARRASVDSQNDLDFLQREIDRLRSQHSTRVMTAPPAWPADATTSDPYQQGFPARERRQQQHQHHTPFQQPCPYGQQPYAYGCQPQQPQHPCYQQCQPPGGCFTPPPPPMAPTYLQQPQPLQPCGGCYAHPPQQYPSLGGGCFCCPQHPCFGLGCAQHSGFPQQYAPPTQPPPMPPYLGGMEGHCNVGGMGMPPYVAHPHQQQPAYPSCGAGVYAPSPAIISPNIHPSLYPQSLGLAAHGSPPPAMGGEMQRDSGASLHHHHHRRNSPTPTVLASDSMPSLPPSAESSAKLRRARLHTLAYREDGRADPNRQTPPDPIALRPKFRHIAAGKIQNWWRRRLDGVQSWQEPNQHERKHRQPRGQRQHIDDILTLGGNGLFGTLYRPVHMYEESSGSMEPEPRRGRDIAAVPVRILAGDLMDGRAQTSARGAGPSAGYRRPPSQGCNSKPPGMTPAEVVELLGLRRRGVGAGRPQGLRHNDQLPPPPVATSAVERSPGYALLVPGHHNGTRRTGSGTPSTKASATDLDPMTLKLQAVGEKLRTEAVARMRRDWSAPVSPDESARPIRR